MNSSECGTNCLASKQDNQKNDLKGKQRVEDGSHEINEYDPIRLFK